MEITRVWEGYVSDINENEFFVKLTYNENGGYTAHEVVFSILELPESDRSLLKEGTYVKWTFGCEKLEGGKYKPVSTVEIIKEKWTKEELDQADKLAKELRNKL